MSSGTASNAYNQKLGLMNAVTVSASQILRRREKSLSELKHKAIGLANRKIIKAIAKMTIIALRLLSIVTHQRTCADLREIEGRVFILL